MFKYFDCVDDLTFSVQITTLILLISQPYIYTIELTKIIVICAHERVLSGVLTIQMIPAVVTADSYVSSTVEQKQRRSSKIYIQTSASMTSLGRKNGAYAHRRSSAGSVLIGLISASPFSVTLNSISVRPVANVLHRGVMMSGTGGCTFGSEDRTIDIKAPAKDARSCVLLYAGVLCRRNADNQKGDPISRCGAAE